MFRGVIEGWRGWSVPKRGCMLMDEAYDSPPVFQTGALPSHLALPSPTLGLCVLGPRLPVFGVTVRVFSRLPTTYEWLYTIGLRTIAFRFGCSGACCRVPNRQLSLWTIDSLLLCVSTWLVLGRWIWKPPTQRPSWIQRGL